MLKVTIHYAKTHLSRLLKQAEQGETIVICHGALPVARLVPMRAASPSRPKVGKPTTSGVSWTADAFEPLTDEELKEWGL